MRWFQAPGDGDEDYDGKSSMANPMTPRTTTPGGQLGQTTTTYAHPDRAQSSNAAPSPSKAKTEV